ncbi:uncharacterized protein [Garra rufa]|uniref:uncharacterized protein n=1 Tax=Garra rufa TaxID=137080 RepID=UPI003CCEE5EE
MIRQKHTQEIMASVMQESLTCQGKNAMIHLSGCGIQLVSKKGRLSRTPALHLLSTHAEDSVRLTLSSSSSSSSSSLSSSSSIQDQGRSPAPPSKRESENLPPRRPLKLAPLQLPLEVLRQKPKSTQGAKVADSKSAETYPRKVKVCWRDGPDKSPERSLLSTITEPHKPLLTVNQTIKLASDRSAGKEAGQTEGNSNIRSTHAPKNVCHSEHGNSQSAAPAKNQDAVKKRLRLRRTQRLEEDQSKSSSSTGGLSAEESKLASAGPGKGQRATQTALRDASRVLEKASRRKPREPGTEAVGNAGRRMAVNDIQEAVF